MRGLPREQKFPAPHLFDTEAAPTAEATLCIIKARPQSRTAGRSPDAQSGHCPVNRDRRRFFSAAAPAFTQNKSAATKAPEAAAVPDQSSLVVGALQIGSAPDLVIPGVDISVAVNSIVYSYYFENTGSTELGLTATVSLPGLQASADGSETWLLASNDPENPIGLTIIAAGAPVTTTAEVHAYALGLDRVAEIKAEHLPLIRRPRARQGACRPFA